VLRSGSRVVDAIRAAGGAPHRRDLSALNLAAVLADGQQIVVGGGSPPAVAPSDPTSSGAPTGGLVNLNTATAEQLDTLPDVGPVTAQSILSWRAANGGFSSVDELLEVDGIGEATLAKIAPHVTV
jgi:competence protein ComEA